MLTTRAKARDLIQWFGYKKIAKVLRVSVTTLKKWNIRSPRTKDIAKIRKRRSLNAELPASHTLDYCNPAFKSLHDSNHHARALKPYHTLGILLNLKTERVIFKIWEGKGEPAIRTEELILKAIKHGETPTVIRIDNQNKINAIKRFKILPQIITKSTSHPHNSHAERTLGRYQKVIQANHEKIRETKDTTQTLKALASLVYDNEPEELLKIMVELKIQVERKILSKAIIETTNTALREALRGTRKVAKALKILAR